MRFRIPSIIFASATNLEGQVATASYLFGGLLASRTRFDGTVVSYSYDDGGDVEGIVYPDARLAFAHDADGLLTSASNSVGVVSNEYDAATGWLVSSHGADGSLVSYAYHLGGGVASISSPAGVVSNVLDVAGRKSVSFTPAGNIGFGYCPWNGTLSVITNVNGTTTSYAYDVMDRVTNITWTTVDGLRIGGFEYSYDAIGRIISRSHDLGTNIFNRSYAYDAMDRLASDGNVSYAYDAADNRIAKTGDVEGDVAYTLGMGNRLQSWTGGSYTYNDAGCVTHIERAGKPTLDLTWDSQYQLISVATNGVFAEGYSYDALGRRVATTTQQGTIRHIYDNNWQCIADVDVNGNVLRSYIWGDGIDDLLAVKIGDDVYTALTDIQGTVWGFTDVNGDVVARWTYDAWGNVLSSDVTVPALAALRYRFQGRECSAVTELMNFRMRWYDAVTGRWLSKDPIRISGGMNLYCFCFNDPLNFCDAYGLEPGGWIDYVQTIIDYAGIFDPTPFCDGVNGLIYLGRGHYDDAIISGMSMFPYVGDFAKAGKYGAKGYKAIKGGRYARTGYASGSEAAKAAAEHGWKDTGRRSHGQKVYTDGKSTYTRDVDSHSGGAWKRYDRQGNRVTLDRDLNPIGK